MHLFRILCATALLVAALIGAPASADVTVSSKVEADGTTTQTHEVVVPAPAEEVWRAISTPGGWMTWAVPYAWATDDPEIMETSYEEPERSDRTQVIQQRFLARIPNKLLVYRTVKAPAGFPHWEDYRQVVSVIELLPEGANTRARLTSAGYPDNEGGRELLRFFGSGNAEAMQYLQLRFADGPRVWK